MLLSFVVLCKCMYLFVKVFTVELLISASEDTLTSLTDNRDLIPILCFDFITKLLSISELILEWLKLFLSTL